MPSKDANGIANNEGPDQTAPLEQSDLGLHCLSRKLRIIMVIFSKNKDLFKM